MPFLPLDNLYPKISAAAPHVVINKELIQSQNVYFFFSYILRTRGLLPQVLTIR
jgi:hypothetical protein